MIARAFGPEGLGALVEKVLAAGYDSVGPRVSDGAIRYDRVHRAEDLPRGWTEVQEKGRYRLERRPDEARFGFTVGMTSPKNFLYPPKEKLFSAERTAEGFVLTVPAPAPKPLAFLGLRGCELAAIAVQDRVFLGEAHRDERYGNRREGALLIAVQCTVAAPTCFCTSQGTGPEIGAGAADVVLTETVADESVHYLAEARTPRGEALLENLGEPAEQGERSRAAAAVTRCRESVEERGRRLDSQGARRALRESPEHPRWNEVAERCINCANCTLVCPTCFCSTVEDTTDLTGEHAERWKRWDSCFTMDFSYLHGGSVRSSAKSRYRQWLTHKLSHWWDQFGTSGCVGCGRCIVWCPVGIDLTEEARAIGGES